MSSFTQFGWTWEGPEADLYDKDISYPLLDGGLKRKVTHAWTIDGVEQRCTDRVPITNGSQGIEDRLIGVGSIPLLHKVEGAILRVTGQVSVTNDNDHSVNVTAFLLTCSSPKNEGREWKKKSQGGGRNVTPDSWKAQQAGNTPLHSGNMHHDRLAVHSTFTLTEWDVNNGHRLLLAIRAKSSAAPVPSGGPNDGINWLGIDSNVYIDYEMKEPEA